MQYSKVPLGVHIPPFENHFAPLLPPLQEVFYLTYTSDDIEGNMHLDTGDKVSFYMETNKQ